MRVKTLDAIKGTPYEVVVSRDSIDGYEVEVRKPADNNDPYVEYETAALRYLEGNSSEHELNNLVQEIIESDRPSLVGIYKDYKEESNGN